MSLFDTVTGFFSRGTNTQETFLSLAITSDRIFATTWELVGDTVNFLGFSHKKFTNIDSLMHEAASAIDDSAKNAKTDVNKVVFGLSHYWLEDGKITKETGNILKDLAQNLDLSAQAFVPIASSVNHLIKVEEDKVANTVLVGALGDFTEVHLLGEDKVLATKIFKGEATAEKIFTLIRDIKVDVGKELPKEITFFGCDEKSHLIKNLDKSKLEEHFGQKPKFEFIDDDDVAKSVAYSQAADVLGHDPIGKASAAAIALAQEEKLSGESPDSDNIEQSQEPLSEGDDFGFVSGKDILKEEATVTAAAPVKAHIPRNKEEYAVDVENVAIPETEYESPQQKIEESTRKNKKSFLESFITLAYVNKLMDIFSGKGSLKKIAVVTVALLVLLVVGSFVASQTITTTEAIIKVNSKPFEDEFAITVAKGASTDISRSRMAGEEVAETVSDSSTTNATGSKKTGTNAKGEVKVLNWTTSKTSFDKGTVVISKSGVKFTLDNSVEVASRSASLPGESNAPVTAQEFGTAGNLDSGTDFTFQKYDELLYSAKSNNAFTGGDEKQATVVAKDDQAKLERSLLDSLTSKAKSTLRERLSDQEVSDDAITIVVGKKTFDHALDEEASQVKLDMEVTASALVYSEQALKDLLAQIAQEDQTDNLEAKGENIDILELDSKKNKDSLALNGKYRANLVPKLSEDELKSKIAGKGTKEARQIIKEISEVSDVEFKFSPNLFFFTSIPKSTDKISLKIEAIK